MSDEIILSYGDSVIRQSDVDIVKTNNWINDVLISFWFEYLSEEICRSNFNGCFVSASVAQFIKLTEYPENAFMLEPLDLHSKDFIFLPVNDHMDFDVSGGSHWTLLLYAKKHNAWYHYDSLSSNNTHHAEILKKKIGLFLNLSPTLGLYQANTSKQTNAMDCGMFTMAFAESIAKDVDGRLDTCILKQEKIQNMRNDLIQTIFQLKSKMK